MNAATGDDEDGSVTMMIHQLRSDDPRLREEAARIVWERYFRELLGLARRHLSGQVRARVDEEDVLQSVYASVCRRQGRGEFDLAGRDDLWKLLVTITLRKARNAARREVAGRRDVRRDSHGDEGRPLADIAALSPTPDEAVALAEAVQLRLAALPDATLRVVALDRLEGHSNREIAASLGCTERSVERKLNLIRALWRDEDASPDDG